MENLANEYRTALNGGIDSVQTTIVVATAPPAALSGGNFRLRLGPADSLTPEYVLVATVSGTTLLGCTRHVEGSATSAWQSGTLAAAVVTVAGLNDRIASLGGGTLATGNGAPTLGANQGYEIAPAAAPTSGTWTCTFRGQTTTALAFNIVSETWVAAMEALSSIGAGNIIVTPGQGGRSLANSIRFQFAGTLGKQPVEAPTITNSTDEPSLTSAVVYQEQAGVLPTSGTGTNGSRYIDLLTSLEYVYLTSLANWLKLTIPSQWTIGANGQLTIAPDVSGVIPLTLNVLDAPSTEQDILQANAAGYVGTTATIHAGGGFESYHPLGQKSLQSRFRGISLWSENSVPTDGDVIAREAVIWFDSTNGAAKLMIKAKTENGTVVTGSVNLT